MTHHFGIEKYFYIPLNLLIVIPSLVFLARGAHWTRWVILGFTLFDFYGRVYRFLGNPQGVDTEIDVYALETLFFVFTAVYLSLIRTWERPVMPLPEATHPTPPPSNLVADAAILDRAKLDLYLIAGGFILIDVVKTVYVGFQAGIYIILINSVYPLIKIILSYYLFKEKPWARWALVVLFIYSFLSMSTLFFFLFGWVLTGDLVKSISDLRKFEEVQSLAFQGPVMLFYLFSAVYLSIKRKWNHSAGQSPPVEDPKPTGAQSSNTHSTTD